MTGPRDELDGRRLALQHAVAGALADASGVPAALSDVVAALGEQLGWKAGAVWLRSPDDTLDCAATWVSDAAADDLAGFDTQMRDWSFRRGQGVPGRAWESGEPVWITDVHDLDDFPRHRLARQHGLRAALAIPVCAGRRVDAVLELFSGRVEAPADDTLATAEGIAHQLAQYLDRVRAVDAEREMRARTYAVVEAALDAIVSTDADSRITEWNPAAERMFGWSRAEAMGRPMAELIVPPRLRAAHAEGMRRYLATGQARVLGKRIRTDACRRNGEEFPVELAITRVSLPGPPSFTAYLRDLSEQARAEEGERLLLTASALLGESLDYETTLRTLSSVVVPGFADWYAVDIVDPDGSVRRLEVAHRDPERRRFAMELAERYPPKRDESRGVPAVIATGRSELLPEIPEDLLVAAARDDEHLALIRSLGLRSYVIVPMRTRERIAGAITFVTAESGRRYDERDLALAEELGRRAGQAIENARLFREVEETRELLEQQATELETQASELQQTAAELEMSNEELRDINEVLARQTADAERARADADEANRAKGEFLAAMSHELRTPLNAIIGYSQLLTDGVHGPLSEQQVHDLTRIDRSAHHLLGLITDILNFAKLEAGRLKFRMDAVDLRRVMDDVEDLVRPQAIDRDLQYRFVADCDPLIVRADRDKLLQVMLNLLSNAVRYTEPGGRIEVYCEVARGRVRVHVRDTGVGIPAEKLEPIFEPFVQVDRAYLGERQGTGLGLAISRELARGMGGDLTVSSEVGVGSTFTLDLAAADSRQFANTPDAA